MLYLYHLICSIFLLLYVSSDKPKQVILKENDLFQIPTNDTLSNHIVELKEQQETDDATNKDTLKKYLIKFLQDSNQLHSSLELIKLARVESQDHRLRIVSYDLAGGGSYHSIVSIAQYLTEKGKWKTYVLNEEHETANYRDVSYYTILMANLGGKNYYLVKGWGSYGDLTHFIVIRAFFTA